MIPGASRRRQRHPVCREQVPSRRLVACHRGLVIHYEAAAGLTHARLQPLSLPTAPPPVIRMGPDARIEAARVLRTWRQLCADQDEAARLLRVVEDVVDARRSGTTGAAWRHWAGRVLKRRRPRAKGSLAALTAASFSASP